MNKIISFLIFICLSSVIGCAQNVKFNGATFGAPIEKFILGFPNGQNLKLEDINDYSGELYNKEVSNGKMCDMMLNSNKWKCYIFSSRKTNTVFRTVCVQSFNDLQNNLMLLVKSLEEKYGGHIEEKQSDLGNIYYFYGSYTTRTIKKEMLALKYEIRGSNNEIIGEIRISAAPNCPNCKDGFIELSYTDLKASKLAASEYNSIMREAL